MLKIIRRLFLGLVVCAGSACVTPTHASSADSVIMTYIQAAGPGGAKEEAIIIHNNASVQVDITGWCLVNKSNVSFACFNDDHNGDPATFTLPGYAYGTVVSEQYLPQYGYGSAYSTMVYAITNQSSGSIVASADTISLVDKNKEVIDWYSWTSSLPSGKGWVRVKLFSLPDIYAVNSMSTDWAANAWMGIPINTVVTSPPVEPELPVEEEGGDGDEEHDDQPPSTAPVSPLTITELLANAVGSDAGNEYIELYNPTDTDIQTGETLRIKVGTENPKWHAVPAGITIPAFGYITLYSSELGFTLVNTNGAVQLYDGEAAVGDPIPYSSPKEGEAWALIEGVWQYTEELTPGSVNLATHIEADSAAETASVQKPCAPNQYRNPETGRCRLIAVETTSLTPCKIGQVRSAETNRCRSIAAVTSAPAPCKEGQERNLDTNRCRNIKAITAAGFAASGVQQKAGAQLQWYYVVAIAGIVLLLAGYAVWEWRQELRSVWQRLKAKFVKRPG